MKAVILGAGQGTRLKKYTENLPKGMLLFMGKTVIERQIELYRTCGIDKIIIVKGFAADKIGYEGVTYYTNEAYAETNMVESLMAAKEEFDDDIIVSYSDILFEKRLLKGMMASPADFAVAVDDDWKAYWKKRYGKENFDTESLPIDENGNIASMREKPQLSFFANTGCYIVEPGIIEELGENMPIGFPDIIERNRKQGKKVGIYPVGENAWMDMGQFDELERMSNRLEKGYFQG